MNSVESNGGRKATKTKEASYLVVIIFAIYSLLLWQGIEMPRETVLLFLGAVGVNLITFTTGNVKEHQAKSRDAQAPNAT